MGMFDKALAKQSARVKQLEFQLQRQERENSRCQAIIRCKNETIKALKAIVMKAKLKGPSELLVEINTIPIEEFTCEGCAALQKELEHTKEALNNSGRELVAMKQFAADACDKGEIERLRGIIREIAGELYGQGFEVAGYHLNGELKPLDSWFEENGWLEAERGEITS